MKKILYIVICFVMLSQLAFADSTYYNYKKEKYNGPSQINFSSLDMKNLTEVKLTFVGMEFNSQGFADFVPLNKPVTLYASSSTDLRVRYKNRPSYEYDGKVNKKDVHFKAKNYFYWNSYLQLLLLPDKKHASKLRCKFNGIENTLSSYIVEKAEPKEDSRTFKYIKRVKNKVESLEFLLAQDLKEIPAQLKYCASNLVYCKYNVHFGSGKPLFGKGKANEVKDVTVIFFAAIESIKSSDGNLATYKTAPRPKTVEIAAKPTVNNKKADKKAAVTNTKKAAPKKAAASKTTKSKVDNSPKANTNKDINSATIVDADLAPRTDSELDDDLVAEVIFVTGAENSLKDERSIAPRTDSELDADLVD